MIAHYSISIRLQTVPFRLFHELIALLISLY